MALRFPSIHHVLIVIGVFPVHCEVGIGLLLIVQFSVCVDVELLLRWVNQFFNDLSCVEVSKRELCASYNSTIMALLMMRSVS